MRPAFFLLLLLPAVAEAGLPRLAVSPNRRHLVTATGEPFFYLGDTAWELFHRLTREEAAAFLDDRAAKGFNVVQAVALAEFDGLNVPNAYGHKPLADNDPARPQEDYFRHVDWVVKAANDRGLYVGFLPTWGDKVGPKSWGVGPVVFNETNAAAYGEFLGRRYKDAGIVWILGGDRNPETPAIRAVWAAMARGIKAGDGGAHLVTFHPQGGATSSTWFHDADWLDFNMQQNGHGENVPVWDRIGADYARTPVKPVMDAEPLYEDHPIGFEPDKRGHSNAADVRKFAYGDVFSGACGHTYGNHAIWQFYAKGREPVNRPLLPWTEAKDALGAGQMRHVRRLIESRPMLSRIPDNTVIASHPGAGGKRLLGTRDAEGSFLMVYAPASRPFTVNAASLASERLVAWWYNPRDGKATRVGDITRRGAEPIAFTPPDRGENLDWVLVLDAADKGFPPPGAR